MQVCSRSARVSKINSENTIAQGWIWPWDSQVIVPLKEKGVRSSLCWQNVQTTKIIKEIPGIIIITKTNKQERIYLASFPDTCWVAFVKMPKRIKSSGGEPLPNYDLSPKSSTKNSLHPRHLTGVNIASRMCMHGVGWGIQTTISKAWEAVIHCTKKSRTEQNNSLLTVLS